MTNVSKVFFCRKNVNGKSWKYFSHTYFWPKHVEIYFAQIEPIDWDVFDKTIITSALSCHGLNWNGNKDTYLYDIQITALRKSQNFYYSKHNLTFRISPMKMNFHSEFKVEKLHTTKGCTCTLSTLVLSVKRHDATHRYATVTV